MHIIYTLLSFVRIDMYINTCVHEMSVASEETTVCTYVCMYVRSLLSKDKFCV